MLFRSNGELERRRKVGASIASSAIEDKDALDDPLVSLRSRKNPSLRKSDGLAVLCVDFDLEVFAVRRRGGHK